MRLASRLVHIVSSMLERDERDVVLGDLAESGETAGRALCDVLGLVARRQAELWKDRMPWFVLAGIVVPLGVLLTLVSKLVADGSAVPIWMYLDNWTWTYVTNTGAWHDLLRNS